MNYIILQIKDILNITKNKIFDIYNYSYITKNFNKNK